MPRVDDGSPDKELIGDLLTGITTPMGQLISDILIAGESGQSNDATPKPKKCPAASPCCVWYDVSAALTNMFLGSGGRWYVPSKNSPLIPIIYICPQAHGAYLRHFDFLF